MFEGALDESLIGKARAKGLLNVRVHDIRDYTSDKHRQADDSPFGGGPGMVLKAEPIAKAVEKVKGKGAGVKGQGARVILMAPTGTRLTHKKALELAGRQHLIIICGRYEGVDQRVADKIVDEEISIGDYVLTGGELPAMVLVDAVSRHIPGVVKEKGSVENDSFYEGLLDHPSYTRPEEWGGIKVPEVLLSGDHKKIEAWRRKESLKRTFFRRPELLNQAKLSEEDRKTLKEIVLEQ